MTQESFERQYIPTINSDLKALQESMKESLSRAKAKAESEVNVRIKSEYLAKDISIQGKEPMPGTKYDSDKPRYDLLPAYALDEVAKVLTFGATKYEPDNWRKVPNGMQRYFASSQRHEWQWKRGEKFDKDSKCHHLACAITGLMFMLELEMNPEYNSAVVR